MAARVGGVFRCPNKPSFPPAGLMNRKNPTVSAIPTFPENPPLWSSEEFSGEKSCCEKEGFPLTGFQERSFLT